jgi:hypothetical protein
MLCHFLINVPLRLPFLFRIHATEESKDKYLRDVLKFDPSRYERRWCLRACLSGYMLRKRNDAPDFLVLQHVPREKGRRDLLSCHDGSYDGSKQAEGRQA